MTTHTPTTEQVRSTYVRAMRNAFIASTGEHEADFDRWLAERDADSGIVSESFAEAFETVKTQRSTALAYIEELQTKLIAAEAKIEAVLALANDYDAWLLGRDDEPVLHAAIVRAAAIGEVSA